MPVKQRLLTAVILIPLVVWGVVALPTPQFALASAVCVLLGAWEWAGLMGLASAVHRSAYLVLVLLAMLAGMWLITLPLTRLLVLFLVVLWWVASLLWIRRFSLDPEGFVRRRRQPGTGHFHSPWLFGMLGVVVLVPPWMALVLIHGAALSGGYLVLLFMLLIWGADSGAYFAGRLWGRTRLAPRVSPGKTWEGVYGGAAAAVLVAVAAGVWFGLGWRTQVTLVLLSLLTVLFSIIGDLFESMIKRMAGVKDSGRLLPGHGGMLDRIDSLTAAAPVYALGLSWQGLIP